jgi:triosephosphate isomerase
MAPFQGWKAQRSWRSPMSRSGDRNGQTDHPGNRRDACGNPRQSSRALRRRRGEVRILYGGSVKAQTAEILAIADVDGALVGGEQA